MYLSSCPSPPYPPFLTGLRLAQLTNKCTSGEEDLEYFIAESGESAERRRREGGKNEGKREEKKKKIDIECPLHACMVIRLS